MDETSTLSKIKRIKKSLEYHRTVLQNIRLFKLFSKFISIIIAFTLCYSAVQNNCTVFLALTSTAVVVFIFAFKVVLEDAIFLRKDFKELTSIIDTISDRLKGKTCNQTKQIEECLNQTEYDKIIFSYLTEQITWNDKCDGLIFLSNTVCLCLSRLNDDNIYVLLMMQILIIISIVISALEYFFLIKRTQKHEELRETFKKFIPFSDDDTHMGDRSKDYKGELVTGNFRIAEQKFGNLNDNSRKRTAGGNTKPIEGIKDNEDKRQEFHSSACPEDDDETLGISSEKMHYFDEANNEIEDDANDVEYREGKEKEIQSLPENSKVKKQRKAIKNTSNTAKGKRKEKWRRNKKGKNNDNDKTLKILSNVKDNESVTDEQSNDATNLPGTTAENQSEDHVSTVKSHSPQTPEKTEDAFGPDWQTVPGKHSKRRQKSDKKMLNSTIQVGSSKEIGNEENSIQQYNTTTNMNNNIESIENIAEQKDKTVGDSELKNKTSSEELRKVLKENDTETSKDNASEKMKGQCHLSANLECKNEQKYSEKILEIKSKELQNDQSENKIATDDELSKNTKNTTNIEKEQFTTQDTNTVTKKSPENSNLKGIPAVCAAKGTSDVKQPNEKQQSTDNVNSTDMCEDNAVQKGAEISGTVFVDKTETPNQSNKENNGKYTKINNNNDSKKENLQSPLIDEFKDNDEQNASKHISETKNNELKFNKKGNEIDTDRDLLKNVRNVVHLKEKKSATEDQRPQRSDLEETSSVATDATDGVTSVVRHSNEKEQSSNAIDKTIKSEDYAEDQRPQRSDLEEASSVATDGVTSAARHSNEKEQSFNAIDKTIKSEDYAEDQRPQRSDLEETSSVAVDEVTTVVRHSNKKGQPSNAIGKIVKSEDYVEEKRTEISGSLGNDDSGTATQLNNQNDENEIHSDNDSAYYPKTLQLQHTPSVDVGGVTSDVNHTNKGLHPSDVVNETGKNADYVEEKGKEDSEAPTTLNLEDPTQLSKQNDIKFSKIDNDNDGGDQSDQMYSKHLPETESDERADCDLSEKGTTKFKNNQTVTNDENIHRDCRTQIDPESPNIEELSSVDGNEDINRTDSIEEHIDKKGSEASEKTLLDNTETIGEVDPENNEINANVNNDNVSGKENLQIEKNESSDEGQNEIAAEKECFENNENATNVKMEQSTTDGQSIIADNVATVSVLEGSKAMSPVDGSERMSGVKHSNIVESTYDVTKTDESVEENAGAICRLEGMKSSSFNTDQMSSKEKEAMERSSTSENKSTSSQEIHRKILDVYEASKNYSSSHQLLKKIRYYQLFLKLLSVIIVASLCASMIKNMCIELLLLLSIIAVMSSLNIRILLRDLGIQSEDDDVLKCKSVSEVKFVEKCCLHNNTDVLLLGYIKSHLEGKYINIRDRFSLKKFLLLVLIDEIALISNSLCFVACKVSSNCENLSIIQNLLMFSLVISVTENLIKRESYHGLQEKKALEKSFKILMSLCSEQLKSPQTAETNAEDEEKCKRIPANDLHANQLKPGVDYKIQTHHEEADTGSTKESEVLLDIRSSEEDLKEMYESIPDDAKERISQDDSKTSSLNSEDKTFETEDLGDKQDDKKLCRTSDASTTDGVIGKIVKFGERLTAYILKDSTIDYYKLNEVERANENDKIVNLHDIDDKEKFHCETDGVPADENNLTEGDAETQTPFTDSNVCGEKAAEHFFSPTVNISSNKNNGEDSTYTINNYETENEISSDRESISKFHETQGLTNEELDMRKSSQADDSADQRDSSNKEEGNAQASTASYSSPESVGISDEHNIYNYEIEKKFLDSIPEILNEFRKLEETEMSIDDELRDQNLQHNSGDKYYNIVNNLLSSLLSVLSVSCQRLCQSIFSSRTLKNDGMNNKQNSNKQSDENKSSESERACYSLDEVKGTIDHDSERQNEPGCANETQTDGLKGKIVNLPNSLLSVLSVSCQRLCQSIFSSRTLKNDGISNKQNSNKQSDENKSSESERTCYSLDEVKGTIDHDSETQNEPGCANETQNDGLKGKIVNLPNSLLSVLSLLYQRVHQFIFSRRIHENDGISNKQNKNKQDIENESSESKRICCSLDEAKDTVNYSETQDFQDDSIDNHEPQSDELKEKKDLFDYEPEVQDDQAHLSNETNEDRGSCQKLTSCTDSSKTEAIDDVNTTNENELLNAVESLNNINRIDGETNGNLEASKSLINGDFRTKEFDHESTFEVKKADEDLTSPEESPYSFTDIKHDVSSIQDLNIHTSKEFSSMIESKNVVNQTEKGIKCVPKVDKSSEICTQKYQDESSADDSSTGVILNRTNYNERISKFENNEVRDEKIEKQNLVENKISEDECHRSRGKKKSPGISEDVSDSRIAKGRRREVRTNEKLPVMNKNGDGNSFNEESGSKLLKNEEASAQSISSPNFAQTKHFPVGNFVSKQNHCSQQVICTEVQPRKNDVKLSHGRFILGMQIGETADLNLSYSCVRLITRDKCVSEHKLVANSKR